MNVISAMEAVALIQSNSTVGIGGFGAWGSPEALLQEIKKSYEKDKKPSNLTVVCGISPGDLKEDGYGLSHMKAEGLIGTIVAAHIGMSPVLGRAVGTNQIAGYTLPLGVYDNLLRASAAKRPGVITKVGLHTFADPRQEGCRVNEKARLQRRKIVDVLKMNGEEYLFYHTFPIDVCLIRGTYADEDGNISALEEAILGEQREMASAVHNQGGIVIVQVKQIVKKGSIPPKEVLIHHSCVDFVIVADAGQHPQGYDFPERYRPELTGAVQIPVNAVTPMPLNVRKVIARRGTMELKSGALINIGIGMPDGVANVANEEGIDATLSIEGGTFGGIPVGGAGLGASVNPEAIYHIADNFDLYDGGGLDMAFLGAAQIDRYGNVNVSKFGTHCTGPGGFIDITQNTPEVYFLGTFTAGKMKYNIADGRLEIIEDAKEIKFVDRVEQITFSAEYAKQTGQRVRYFTERAVFSLTDQGLELLEIAPGIDLQRDILDKMEFVPIISDHLKEMEDILFREEKMCIGLKKQ